jgi:hypothetical protein
MFRESYNHNILKYLQPKYSDLSSLDIIPALTVRLEILDMSSECNITVNIYISVTYNILKNRLFITLQNIVLTTYNMLTWPHSVAHITTYDKYNITACRRCLKYIRHIVHMYL